MTATQLLIASDAGAAGRVLLARRDLDLRWALTAREARAVLRGERTRVAVVTEELAGPVLAALRRDASPPPSIILTREDRDHGARYTSAGATAVVPRSSSSAILGAISSITGLRFAAHPRVPYRGLLYVATAADKYFLESHDLSAEGIAIRGLPGAKVGLDVDVSLLDADPPIDARGRIVRTFPDDGETIAAVALTELGSGERRRMGSIVDEELRRLPALPDPSELSCDLPAVTTLDLRDLPEGAKDPNAGARAQLRAAMEHRTHDPLPAWLQRVHDLLAPIERAGLLGMPVPPWVMAAVDQRLMLHQLSLGLSEGPGRDVLVGLALELCTTLAAESETASEELASEITVVRAGLLRDIYAPPRRARAGSESAAPPSREQRTRATGGHPAAASRRDRT